MSDKYKIRENDKAYLPAGKASFVTLTIVDWIDVFTRKGQKLMILNSLKYCQENKGLVIFGYCIMSSHIHMICKSDEDLIVVNAEDYLYSTARNYADLDSLLDVCLVDQKLIIYG